VTGRRPSLHNQQNVAFGVFSTKEIHFCLPETLSDWGEMPFTLPTCHTFQVTFFVVEGLQHLKI
jgi:hypothetical protein